MELEEFKRHEVDIDAVPLRWLDLAEWGRNWVYRRVFPAMKGRTGGYPPRIRWYAGPPATLARGSMRKWTPDEIWVRAMPDSLEELVEVGAHETAHCAGYEGEDVPALVGRMAVKAYTGEATVFVHHGPVHYAWMPDGVSEVPHNAVVLAFDDGRASTHTNDGTATRPSWRQTVIP